uniref:histone deacetylase n=1 Tax=Pinguiococcus pyrenoidosus TaxID=172671 RepID=A0A7R9UC77_9STRA|mmetsp:Transcript_2912/g.11788  ORF Transcript_2912/g.11788 Transcript_2912/m.11788 type:complete len:830 (+) Transcript_2912:157-2646(+)
MEDLLSAEGGGKVESSGAAERLFSSPSLSSSKASSPFGLSISLPVTEELRLPPPALAGAQVGNLTLPKLQTPLTSRQNSFSDDSVEHLHGVVRLQNLARLRGLLDGMNRRQIDCADDDGYTALMIAAALDTASASEIVDALVQAGADLERHDKKGFTALHWAAAVGTVATLRVLAKYGAEVDARSSVGDTPLHRAALLGRVDAVEALVDEFHANAKVHNNQGELAAQLSCRLLLDDSASPEASCRILGLQQRMHRIILEKTPEMIVSVFCHSDCMEHIAGTAHQESPRRLAAILDTLHADPSLALDEAVELRRAKLSSDRESRPSEGDAAQEGSDGAGRRGKPSCLAFVSDFDLAPIESVERIHSEQYVRFVRMLADSLGAEESVPFTPRVQRSCFGIKTPRAKPAAACDTSFSKATLRAALRACGAAIAAVDAVLQPELGYGRRAFCCVRPPGHHAGIRGLGVSSILGMGAGTERSANGGHGVPRGVLFTPGLPADPYTAQSGKGEDRSAAQLAESASCGFCIFNNVCVAAAHALSKYRMTIKRIAVIDIDVHHGNGTEEIVKMLNSSNVRMGRPPSIFFASSHVFDRKFYPGTGQGDDLCRCCMNLPLHPLWEKRSPFAEESGRNGWRSLIKNRLLFSLRCFHPDLILVSAGFDGAKGDIGNRQSGHRKAPVGLDLKPDDYRWLATELRAIANVCCDGRVVAVLEGGYGARPHPAGKQNRGAAASEQQSNAEWNAPGPAIGELDLTNFGACVGAFVGGLAGAPIAPSTLDGFVSGLSPATTVHDETPSTDSQDTPASEAFEESSGKRRTRSDSFSEGKVARARVSPE